MIEMKLTGEAEINKLIQQVSQKVQKESAFESLVIACMPVVEAMKRNAPVDEGSLRESIGFRLRRYRGGRSLYLVIGPRRGTFGPNNDRPSVRAHLIEMGHWAGKGANRKFVAAKPFMRNAWLEKGPATLAEFKRQFGDRLIAEVVKRAAKKKKTS